VLKPVVECYQGNVSRIYFRADAGFANPDVYEFLEAERIKYAMRLPANRILQERIGHLLTRPIGQPLNDVRRSYANFTYQAGSWTKSRRVVAKVEWHPGELYPRVGFIVTNMSRRAKRVVAFYNKRGTCEQWIKEGKGAIKWTRLSCRTFAANAVRLQHHALAYNLGNFLRTLATPEPIKDWSLTSLKEKLIKIGAKVVRHGRYIAFQMAEVAKAGVQNKVPVKIILEATDSVASYYLNYLAVAQTPNDFTIYGGRIPAKLTQQRLNIAQESGTLTIDADVEITFPATIMTGLIGALNIQKELLNKIIMSS